MFWCSFPGAFIGFWFTSSPPLPSPTSTVLAPASVQCSLALRRSTEKANSTHQHLDRGPSHFRDKAWTRTIEQMPDVRSVGSNTASMVGPNEREGKNGSKLRWNRYGLILYKNSCINLLSSRPNSWQNVPSNWSHTSSPLHKKYRWRLSS